MARSVSTRVRVPLAYPIEVDGVTYQELRMRPAKRRDAYRLRDHRGDDRAIGMALVARMCGVPEAVIYALHLEDYVQVAGCADRLAWNLE
jgi:hypothetical protein